MWKAKTIKISVADLIQKVQTGEISLFGNQEQMEEQSLQALKRLSRGNPGFAVFDRQKMLGRISILEKSPSPTVKR
jgi:predicted nucleotidyltransferase